jgi:predicted ribosome quality control (RQC) complex YloA/Tae2 family protein
MTVRCFLVGLSVERFCTGDEVTMLLDGLSIFILREELEKAILDGIIDGIHQLGRYEVLLVVRKPGETIQVLISANPQYSRIHLTEMHYQLPNRLTPFCMTLRKYLNRGRVVFAEQPGCERMICLGVSGYDELGNEEVRILSAEVMGRHSNIVLYKQDGAVILDSIVRVTKEMSSVRQVLPGKTYEFPPEQDKLNPYSISRVSLASLLSTGFGATRVYNILLKNIAGIGPQLAREIVAYAGYSPETSIAKMQETDDYVERISEAFFDIIDLFRSCRGDATVVREMGTNAVLGISAIRPKQSIDVWLESYDSLSKACDVYYGEKVTHLALQSKKEYMYQVVRKLRGSLETTLKRLNENHAKCENADAYLRVGDILSANLFRIKRGDVSIELEDFYAGDDKIINIRLDPKLTPTQNMQDYYRRYTKAKRGLETVEKNILGVKAEMEYLGDLELSIEQASSVSELEEIEQEMKESGYIKASKHPAKKVVTQPLEMRIGGHFSIIVGKNNRQNDRITTKLACPDDLWFHVKDFPGSHVVLRIPKGCIVPESVLEQTAEIAAYYSKARDSENVAVDYALVKHVSKPKNAKPGRVIYRNYKTLYVMPRLPLPSHE